MLEEKDVAMTFLVVSGMVTSHSMVDLDSTCGAEHEDSPFCCSYEVIIFFLHVWVDEISSFFFSIYLRADSRYQTHYLLCMTCYPTTNYVKFFWLWNDVTFILR